MRVKYSAGLPPFPLRGENGLGPVYMEVGDPTKMSTKYGPKYLSYLSEFVGTVPLHITKKSSEVLYCPSLIVLHEFV